MKKTMETITAKQRERHYISTRVMFDPSQHRLTNANSPGIYTSPQVWQRPGSDHSQIKSKGIRC